MTKLVFASTCVFFLLIMTFPTALFAQKPKIEWDSINHKYLYFVNRPNNGSYSLITLVSKQLEKKGYDTLIAMGFLETQNLQPPVLFQFQKNNNLPVGKLDSATLKALGIEVIRGVEIDDSRASPQPTLFTLKPKIEWDSINHKYLYFVDRPPTNSRIELVALIYKQLNEKGYKNNYMNDCCGESRKALNQFLKENGFEILTEAALNKLDIEMIHEVEIDDSWASPQLQKALRQFQRDNGLREGFLDDKTLKALGIAE